MMLSIVGVKSLIIKSALNLNLSLNIVILSTYDDESMADCKLFPPKSLHFPSIATNGIVTLTFEDAGMSVLKGAVLFGHRPDFIRSRVMKCSYGVKTNIPFDKRRHDVKQKVLMDGEEKCDNIFSPK
jgi:hypothetical protein